MVSIKKNLLLSVLIASVMVLFGAMPLFARADNDHNRNDNDHDRDGHSYQWSQCHNGIDDDHDGYIDLLDRDCAEFRPHCEPGMHPNENFECVHNDDQDDNCIAPQVLVNHNCVDPEPLLCPEGQVANAEQTACVPATPTCAGAQTLVDNQCVDPACNEGTVLNAETHTCVAIPVCVGAQTLVNNQCVDPVCNVNQTLNIESHQCIDNVVVPACTESQHLENNVCVNNPANESTTSNTTNGGGGGNGPIAGPLGNGGSIVPGGNGPIAGTVLGASTSILPELPSGCSALLRTFMRIGRSNDTEEVKKLQGFLNKELGLSIEVTGYFGKDTDAGVRKFQLTHTPEVLTPWGISDSTGFVYKTTQRWINLMSCKSLDIPMPELN